MALRVRFHRGVLELEALRVRVRRPPILPLEYFELKCCKQFWRGLICRKGLA